MEGHGYKENNDFLNLPTQKYKFYDSLKFEFWKLICYFLVSFIFYEIILFCFK